MKKRIAYHCLFWLIYLIWGSYITGSYDGNYKRAFLSDLIHLPVKLAVAYFLLYYLLPRYNQTKRYGQQLIILILLIIVSAFIFRATIYFIIQPYFYPESEIHFWNYPKFLWSVFEVFSISAIAVSIKLFKGKYEGLQREQELEKEKLKTELRFLKAQINPHFLFNTLNNIYGLSLKKAPETPESILKLSGLLQFMVHDGSEDSIKLTDEITAINDYIALEKLRYGKRLNIIFEKELENENVQIAPMILLSFIENSFKHGAGESRKDSFIHIKLVVKDEKVLFQVTNSKEGESSDDQTGIGLKNISRQLDLIYGKSHSLDIYNSSELFTVVLKINLNDHAKTSLSHR